MLRHLSDECNGAAQCRICHEKSCVEGLTGILQYCAQLCLQWMHQICSAALIYVLCYICSQQDHML